MVTSSAPMGKQSMFIPYRPSLWEEITSYVARIKHLRPKLLPSTPNTITHRTFSWFFTILFLSFAPLILPALATLYLDVMLHHTVHFLLSLFPKHLHCYFPLAFTTVYRYCALFLLLYGLCCVSLLYIHSNRYIGQFLAPDMLALNQLAPLMPHRRHHVHWSHMQLDQFWRLIWDESFTVFIQGTGELQTNLVSLCLHLFTLYSDIIYSQSA